MLLSQDRHFLGKKWESWKALPPPWWAKSKSRSYEYWEDGRRKVPALVKEGRCCGRHRTWGKFFSWTDVDIECGEELAIYSPLPFAPTLLCSKFLKCHSHFHRNYVALIYIVLYFISLCHSLINFKPAYFFIQLICLQLYQCIFYLLSTPSESVAPFINWFGVHLTVRDSAAWCSER